MLRAGSRLYLLTAVAATSAFRLLTFDLDDTLWPIDPVVRAANTALVQGFAAKGVQTTSEDIQAQMKLVRLKHMSCEGAKKLSYTQLRLFAIDQLLSGTPAHPEGRAVSTQAHALFDVWLEARHEAAAARLYDGTADALASVRRAYPHASVGAITNGRGDPLQMPAIAEYFRFTVSGEDAGVHPHRKPSPRIFNAALEIARAQRSGDDGSSLDWVHVGDDLLNDMAAAKAVGARTVWLDRTSSPEEHSSAVAFYSTQSDSEAAARRDALSRVSSDQVDARIQTIASLPNALYALWG